MDAMSAYQAVRLWGIAVAFTTAAACSSQLPGETNLALRFTADTLAAIQLQGQALETGDSLGMPYALIVGQNYVLVADVMGEPILNIFDRQHGGWVASGGKFGEGPREFGGLRDIIRIPGRDAAWVFDFAGRSIQFVDMDSLVLNRSLSDRRLLLDGGPGDPYSPVWTADSTIVSSGTYGSNHFAVFAADGSFLNTAGPAPPGDEEMSPLIRRRVYSSVLRASPNGKKIVAAYDRSDRLEIYEGTELRHVVRGPDFFEPAFTVRVSANGYVWPDYSEDEYRYGYEDVTVTDHLIFALYSGKTLTESPTGEDNGSYIIVFTWDGQPILVLQVGNGPQRIAVSEDGRDLYVAYWLPTPLIKRYSMTDLM